MSNSRKGFIYQIAVWLKEEEAHLRVHRVQPQGVCRSAGGSYRSQTGAASGGEQARVRPGCSSQGSRKTKWGENGKTKRRQREDRHRDWVFKVCEKTRGLTEAMVSLCVTLEAHFSLDGAAGPTGSSGADRGVDRPELLHR